MRSPSLFMLVAVVASIGALHACNCGGGGGAGTPCTETSDCASGLECIADVCAVPDEESDAGDGGRDGGDAGDAGNDGGDAGCVGLECQQIGCADGGTTTLLGAVYDPSGTVPLYNALVYVPNGELEPLPEGVRCETCGAAVSGKPIARALTGADGGFVLRNVPIGSDIPLVIQMGKWRRQVTIPSVPACQATPITDVNLLRMPRNRTEGDMPQFAISTGEADPFECLLKKIGISESEFTRPDGGGRVHFYREATGNSSAGGLFLDGGQPAGDFLYADAGSLAKYDVVILPCQGVEDAKAATETQALIDYANAGGRVFATHFSYVWIRYAQHPWPDTADWRRVTTQNPPNPFSVNGSFPKGAAFVEWLTHVGASTTPGELNIVDSRHSVREVDAGVATAWITGVSNSIPTTQHLTFNTPVYPQAPPDGGEPVQCGRVVFSDFHVTTSAVTSGDRTFPRTCRQTALTPQEKALIFMLFDLAACVQSDDKPPQLCAQQGEACASDSNCCSGLACLAASGAACTGSGCTCEQIIGGQPPGSLE